MLYTASQNKPSIDNLGLSRFGLGGYLVLSSDVVGLAYSKSDGRVVLVRDKNEMHKIFGKIAKEREKYIETLESAKNEIESKIRNIGK